MSRAAAVQAFRGSSNFERANTVTLSQIRAQIKVSTVTIDWVLCDVTPCLEFNGVHCCKLGINAGLRECPPALQSRNRWRWRTVGPLPCASEGAWADQRGLRSSVKSG
jgi:hypothetical protein